MFAYWIVRLSSPLFAPLGVKTGVMTRKYCQSLKRILSPRNEYVRLNSASMQYFLEELLRTTVLRCPLRLANLLGFTTIVA